MDSASGAGKAMAVSRPLTAEEEAIKRNTDCIYFLASPLTCKKGSECEYRHSEGARLNPRDCHYWLNGNCSNSKCLFRHPPLDGLYGLPGTTPAPYSQIIATAQPTAPYNHNKQGVPCHYFQIGHCSKGDRCHYMHGPQPTGTSGPQQVGKVSTSSEPPQTLKKTWGFKNCIQQDIARASIDIPKELLSSSAKPVIKAEINPSNGFAFGRSPFKAEINPSNGFAFGRSPSSYELKNELPRFQPINVPSRGGIAVSMPQSLQSQPVEECLQNGRDADELLAESSPGFDVLVDDDIEDADYLQNEEGFGKEAIQSGRDLFSAANFNHHDFDYKPVVSFEKYHYDGIELLHANYGREQQRSSPDKIVGRLKMPERRVRRRESPEGIDNSDLRHQLRKQRRISGLRSTVGSNRHSEPYQKNARPVEGDRFSDRHSHRDQRHLPSWGTVSPCLQGRITLPGRSATDRLVDSRSERERDRGRHGRRLSPASLVNYPEKHDRLKKRIHEDFAEDTSNLGGQNIRRNYTNPGDFAGPKSLVELKNNQHQSVKSRITSMLPPEPNMKLGKPVDLTVSDVSCSFEGPKPLSDILKMKKENAPDRSAISGNDGNNYRSSTVVSSGSAAVSDHKHDPSPAAVEGLNTSTDIQVSKVGFPEVFEDEGLIAEAGEYVHSPAKDTFEVEEGTMMGTDENRGLQISDRLNAESDSETAEGGDAKVEDDENFYLEDEELRDDDNDDEDDFARKVSVMFS